MLPLSHVQPCFPTIHLSSLHLNEVYKPISHSNEVWYWRYLVLYFLHFIFFTCTILIFQLKKFSCLNFGKIPWSSNFVKVRPISLRLFFLKINDHLCFLWEVRFWILIIGPSNFYSLTYWRLNYLISIEFQNINNSFGFQPRTFSSLSIIIILQSI
jgi:hypothetical protein